MVDFCHDFQNVQRSCNYKQRSLEMKHIAKRLLSLLLVVCLVLSVAVIPAGAAETKLTSVYASYAAEGHTNAPDRG